ncbi:MAG: YlxR family protein [Acidimicrobiia bacterium]
MRIAAAPNGTLAVGPGPGRGAWLCAGSVECLEQAVERQALARALRRPVTVAEVDGLRAKLFT